MRESSLSSTSNPDEDKMLQELQRKTQRKVIQNNFTLLIILNIVSYVVFIFSSVFYRWYELQIILVSSNNTQSIAAHNLAQSSSTSSKSQYGVWLNTLYVYNQAGKKGEHYLSYHAYQQSSDFICNNMENQSFCNEKFDQMSIIGYVCFSLLMLGILLQTLDLYRIIKLRSSLGQRSGIKAFWLHPAIISIYSAGFLTYFISVLYFQIADEDIIFDFASFGVSFWIGVVSIPVYIILSIYYRKIKNKLKSSELVDDLINRIEKFEEKQKKKNEQKEKKSLDEY